jgi:heavy metal sensor kinase
MPSKSRIRPFDSFKLRLALLSAGVFAFVTFLSFFYLYRSLSNALDENVDDSLRAEFKEFKDIYQSGGLEALRKEIVFEEEANGKDEVFMRAFGADGTELVSSDLSFWEGVSFDSPTNRTRSVEGLLLYTLQGAGDGSELRCIRGPIAPGITVEMGFTLRENALVLSSLWTRFQRVLGVMLCLCILGAWFLAKRAMSGVEAVTHTAAQITEGDLDRRVHLTGEGIEIDRLAETFNTMLDRIAVLVGQIKEINDNVAHELRSPIARIRGNAEVALLSEPSVEDYRELTGSIIEECDGLLLLVNTMLDISELESGIARVGHKTVDVAELVRDTCDLFQPAAEDLQLTLNSEVCDEAVVSGDSRLLGRALLNIIDNAVKYTPQGGTVTASVALADGHVRVFVEDTGIGIAPDDLSRIFDRFYRGKNGQTKPGTGLGLGLARAVIRAHVGRVEVSSVVGEGTRFAIFLPLAEKR